MQHETENKTGSRGSYIKWYVLALVSLTLFFVSAERMCLPVLFKEIAEDLNLSLVQVGTVWGMDPLAGVFVSLFSGLLIDRFGVKRTVTTIVFFTGAFGLLRGLAVNFISLASIMFIFGLIVATTPTILPKVVALWFKDRHLGLASGISATAGSLGGMAASLTSALVFLPLLGGWRSVLIFFGLPPILLSFMWLTTYGRHSEVESNKVIEDFVPFRHAFSHVIRIKDVWIIGFFGFGGFGALSGVVGYLPLYLRELGWDPVFADSAMTLLIGSIGLTAIPVSLLSDRLRSRKEILPPVLLSLALSLCLLPLAKGPWVWILIMLTGLTYGGLNPLFMALVIETKGVGSTYAGTAFGISVSLSMIGSFISPPLGNSMAHFNLGMPFVFWGVLCGVVLIGFFFFGEKEKEKDSRGRARHKTGG